MVCFESPGLSPVLPNRPGSVPQPHLLRPRPCVPVLGGGLGRSGSLRWEQHRPPPTRGSREPATQRAGGADTGEEGVTGGCRAPLSRPCRYLTGNSSLKPGDMRVRNTFLSWVGLPAHDGSQNSSADSRGAVFMSRQDCIICAPVNSCL